MNYASYNGRFRMYTVPDGYTLHIQPHQLDLVAIGSGPSQWANAVSGSWSIAGNWTGSVPNAAGKEADLQPSDRLPR